MTLRQALGCARETLAASRIEEASLEGELLLRHTARISRTELYLKLDDELSPEQEESLQHLVRQRLNGEPTAYITKHREFYGLDFFVDSRVLIPRPESEILVEKALNYAQNHPVCSVADIGTGCGVIAISLALNLPQARIYATDISASALDVARFNCQKHGVTEQICLFQGDMLAPVPEPVDLIVANLPYVKESELHQIGSTDFEPRLALDGGPNGLEKILKLCHQAGDKLSADGCLFLEIGLSQKKTVTDFLRKLFPSATIEVTPDLSGIERVVSVTPNIASIRVSH